MHAAFDQEIKVLLDQRRGGWQAVADGAGVSYSWLSKFANGHIDNPGYGTLRKLHAYLSVPEVMDRRSVELPSCHRSGRPPICDEQDSDDASAAQVKTA